MLLLLPKRTNFHTSNSILRTTDLTEMFLKEKHDVQDSVFLIDSASWLKAVLHHLGLRF